ncbi:MAG: PLP-dependent transferase, partial [Chloroflexi bacterium]|nr:PLP-dependent transferase [Chloroflexota bacterium]
FAALGVTVSAIPTEDLDAVAAELAARRPRVLLVETISNPLVRVADLPKLAELSRRHGTALVVDATFTSPYLQRPLELGANLVVHSATKYLGGHGDATGGIVLTNLPMQAAQIQHYLRLTGSVLGPHEAWLLLRGLKTLSLRMQRQCENATAVADWLAGRPEVAQVNYPGRPDHPEHDLAKRLLRDGLGGAIVSFELREGTRAAAFRFMDGLQLIQSATTLGDVYTTALYPPMASHRSQTRAQRQAMGIRDGLVRLSLGIETLSDLQADLAQALAGLG